MQRGFPSHLPCSGCGFSALNLIVVLELLAGQRLASGGFRYPKLRTRLGPTNASTATWMRRHLLRDGQQVSSLPCWCSSLGSSWQMPTPAPARDATTWRLINATAQSPNLPAMLGEAPGRTRADPVIPRPTSSIPIAKGNTPGVALMRPVMLVSAPSPRRPVKQLLARPGPMSAWVSKQGHPSLCHVCLVSENKQVPPRDHSLEARVLRCWSCCHGSSWGCFVPGNGPESGCHCNLSR